MTLPVEEFIRRFLLHILPHRFVRIRYYGLLANRHRERQLERCRALLGFASPAPRSGSSEREDWESVYQRVTGKDLQRSVASAVAVTSAGSASCPPWRRGRRHDRLGSPRLRVCPSPEGKGAVRLPCGSEVQSSKRNCCGGT